jgi:pimeloyl-ACP methyl ester carboxylesterase
MVHGAFCGGWAFETFRQPFEARGMDVRALDLPGHGVAPDRGVVGRASMSDYAKAVALACAECCEPPVLIGHSMGGLVCQLAAARTPVRGLILLAPSAPWGVHGSTVEEAVSAVSLMGMSPFWSIPIDPDFTLAAQYSLNRFPAEARKNLYRRMGPESGRALWETLNWWLDPFMTTNVSPAGVSAPVLAVAGGRDLIHPPVTVRQTAARLSGKTVVFDEMSHWLIGEPGWEQVAGTCLDWMTEL